MEQQQINHLDKIGDWDIEKMLGDSPSSESYLVTKGNSKGVLNIPYKDTPNLIHHEIEILKQVGDHPNIINILDSGLTNGVPYWVSEFLPFGWNLNSFMQWESEELSPNKIDKDIESIAHAIGYCHSQGIVRNGVWQYNIMFREDYTPVLRKFAYAEQWSGHFPDTSVDLYGFAELVHKWKRMAIRATHELDRQRQIAQKNSQREKHNQPKVPRPFMPGVTSTRKKKGTEYHT
jgi:serine/threonine protein kinase